MWSFFFLWLQPLCGFPPLPGLYTAKLCPPFLRGSRKIGLLVEYGFERLYWCKGSLHHVVLQFEDLQSNASSVGAADTNGQVRVLYTYCLQKKCWEDSHCFDHAGQLTKTRFQCKQTTLETMDLLLRWTGTSQHSNAQARVTCPGFARCGHVMILQRWLAS